MHPAKEGNRPVAATKRRERKGNISSKTEEIMRTRAMLSLK